MTTLTNNDFVKGYYGIYTSNSGYTGDIGDDTHPADNQWVGINIYREQYSPINIVFPDLMYCRNLSTYWLHYEPGNPYLTTLVSTPPLIYGCPQQIIINPTSKAQKTVTLDMMQIPVESGQWVKKGMNKVVKNDVQLSSDSVLSVFVDTLSNKATGLLDSVLVLRESELTTEASIINQIVQPETVMDELEKEINEYLISADEFGFDILPVSTIDRIREIAEMCPFTEGEAVYKARIIAAYFDPFGTDYSNNCEFEMENKNLTENTSTGVEIILAIPNPTSGSFMLQSEEFSGTGNLSIYDLSGRCLWTGEATMNETIVIENLSNGLYYFHLTIGTDTFIGNISVLKE